MNGMRSTRKPSGWHRKKKGTAAEAARRKKYDSPQHRAARKALTPIVAAGGAICWRCRNPIAPGSRWHVGHDDHDVNLIRGAEHPGCNVGAAAKKGAAIKNARYGPPRRVTITTTTTLDW